MLNAVDVLGTPSPIPCLSPSLSLSPRTSPYQRISWWRHQLETFSASLALCERNPPVTGGISTQRPVTRSFNIFFDVRLNKPLS